MEHKTEKPDWKKVLVEVIVKILTLGFYHVRKHHLTPTLSQGEGVSPLGGDGREVK